MSYREVGQVTATDVQFIQQVYDAFNRGDLDAVVESFTEDAVQESVVIGETNRGRDEIRRSFADYFELVEDHRTETVEFIEESGLIVVPVLLHGRMRHTGIGDGVVPPVEMTHVFSVRDGRIEWNYICAGLEEGLAAARARAAASSSSGR